MASLERGDVGSATLSEGSTRIYGRAKCSHRVGDIRHRYFSGLCRNYLILKYYGLVVLPIGGVFPHLPHHLDLASEDSVGHSTYMHECANPKASPTHSPATRLHVLWPTRGST